MILREAELRLRSDNRGEELDALFLLEEGMRHFYIRAVQLKTSGKADPKEIDDNLLKAVDIAEKIAPYRHHKLAAIKLNKDPVDPALRVKASLEEELRVQMLKHWERLVPVLDLKRLIAPSEGIANRKVQEG